MSEGAPLTVFEGSQRACAEAALVLESKSIPFELIALESGCAIQVAPQAADAAREELARYAAERRPARVRPPALVPFGGAGWGSAGYALVLLLAAYCTGIQAFGADWLARGSLDARSVDWWRPITALTLHLDQSHLLGNLLFGIGIGALAGRAFGPGIAWASILAAGAAANCADMLISPPTHRAVGASTAVFAALGLLVGFAWRHGLALRDRFKYAYGPLFGGLCLLALLGAGDEHVDVLGHALGFLTGLALGWLCSRYRIPRSRSPGVQAAAGAAALALIASAWFRALR
jgi:membrane associated rhomboid family serine protease